MIDEKPLTDFTERMKTAAGPNLVCIALYGSAVSDEFHPGFSDVNLLCVLNDISAPALKNVSATIGWWVGTHNPAPLIFARAELAPAAEVFPIEMLDIRRQHRVLYGEDCLTSLKISMARHGVQLEHELRTKLLFLRQHYVLAAGDAARIRHLMLDSVSNFITLFRHALIAMGQQEPATKRDVLAQLSPRVAFDPAPFLQLLDVREGKSKPDSLDAQLTFNSYLEGIQKVIQFVDALPGNASNAAGAS
jgi:predicted nucleotidyltransferase